MNKVLSHYVRQRCLFGDDKQALNIAFKLFRNEVGLSFDLVSVIVIAKILNLNPKVKKIALNIINNCKKLPKIEQKEIKL